LQLARQVRSFTTAGAGIFDGTPKMLQNQKHINIDPIACPFKDLPPVSLQLASQSDLEPLWDHLMRSYHYLGCRKLF
jgi:hypothetical protein